MDPKKALRKAYKLKRKKLGESRRKKLSAQICENVLAFLDDRPYLKHIHLYLPIAPLFEVDIFPLVPVLLDREKTVYTSVTDFDREGMHTVKIEKDTKISMSQMGIPEPVMVENTGNDEIQVVFVPLLAYDLKGNRLGYGKGYYDRFLAGLSKEVFKVGLSYFPPEKQIEVEPHDIPLDICISPDHQYTF